jgi:uncharacterized protein Yka (UPF0111/DUF47 family)
MKTELDEMIDVMMHAAALLRKFHADFIQTMDYREMNVRRQMNKLIEAYEELEAAVSLYRTIREDWSFTLRPR